MRILVAGGAGFLGSNLCKKLSKEHEVIALDNLITGKNSNLKDLDIRFVKHDITKPLPAEIKDIDLIFNLASPASPVDYRNHAIETLLVGSVGMLNLLEFAARNKSRIFHASTSEVYGDPLQHPQKETYWGNVNPIGERSQYDESKRFSEALCIAFNKHRNVNLVIGRIFNTYGECMRMDDGRMIPNFIYNAINSRSIEVHGDGRQTRSFCYVSDLIDAIATLGFSEISGEVFNIGTSEEHTVLEMANIIRKLCNSSSEIVFKGRPPDDPGRRKPDISKVKKATGWEPKVKLEEGLKRTIEWFRNNST